VKRILFSLACKLMSETIFHEMNNADPNERVQVGSYRVDGHGHQKLKDVIEIYIYFLLINRFFYIKGSDY
jgi:hypothetical protein